MALSLRLGCLPSELEREGDAVIATYLDLLTAEAAPADGLNEAERAYFAGAP